MWASLYAYRARDWNSRKITSTDLSIFAMIATREWTSLIYRVVRLAYEGMVPFVL